MRPLARRLRRIRLKKGWSYAKMAKWFKVSKRTYTGWECGQHQPYNYTATVINDLVDRQEKFLRLGPLPPADEPPEAIEGAVALWDENTRTLYVGHGTKGLRHSNFLTPHCVCENEGQARHAAAKANVSPSKFSVEKKKEPVQITRSLPCLQ